MSSPALVLRQCSVAGCTRLCFKQSDSCKYHTDNPPLSRLFEPPSPQAQSQSQPRLVNYSTVPIPSINVEEAIQLSHDWLSGSITGRDTFSKDRVVNTADLIPYEIPLDHEDGRPPPTIDFLYDEIDSGREAYTPREPQRLLSEPTSPLLAHPSTLSSHAAPSPKLSPSHPSHHSHPILLIDTKDTRVIEEKNNSSSFPYPRSSLRAASASMSIISSSSTSANLPPTHSPRRVSLSPRSPLASHSQYGTCQSPRSIQALVDRLTMLENNNNALVRENLELKSRVDSATAKEELLLMQLKEMQSKLVLVEDKATSASKSNLSEVKHKAPIDLPPVINVPSSLIASLSLSSLSALPSQRSMGGERMRSHQPPQLAPITHSPPFSHSAPPSAASPLSINTQYTNGHHHSHSHYLNQTSSPSPSASPMNSRPSSSSRSFSETVSPSISPVTSFYSNQQPPSQIQPSSSIPPLNPIGCVGSYRPPSSVRVKSSSNGANTTGYSMNVGNALGSQPCIKLYPVYSSGHAMKALLTDEGMGLRDEATQSS